jgi:hypothetical protein
MRKHFFILLAWAVLSLPTACQLLTEPGPDEVRAALGTMQATIGGVEFVFASDGGIDPVAANSYTQVAGLVSVFRQVSPVDQRRLQLTLTALDLDNLAVPTDVAQGAQLRFFAGGSNQRYEATGSDLTLRLVGKQGDVLSGTFSATLRSTQNSRESLRLTNGSFRLALQRF